MVCVEKDPAKRKLLIENVSIAEERILCHIVSAELYVRRTKERFDIVFCDPPFPYRFRESLCLELGSRGIVKEGGLLLVHRPAEDPLPASFGPLSRIDQRIYGRSIVDFFRAGALAKEGSDDSGTPAPSGTA